MSQKRFDIAEQVKVLGADSLLPPDRKTQVLAKGCLGKLIAYYRQKRGMSLQDVADEAHTSKAHVWCIEKGRSRNPSVELIFGLSVALDCDPCDILKCAIADLPDVVSVTSPMAARALSRRVHYEEGNS